MIRCGDDSSFGPVLTAGPNCLDFDFTLVFEDYIFSIAPYGIGLLLAAYRIYSLLGQKAVVRWPFVRALKLVSCQEYMPPFSSGAHMRRSPMRSWLPCNWSWWSCTVQDMACVSTPRWPRPS